MLNYILLLHHPTCACNGSTNWMELLLSHCMRPTSSSRIFAWQTKQPRSTKEPFKTKFQPSLVSTSRIPSSTCTLFFKVHTRHISLSFYICALEFYRRVAWLLICSWTSSLYTSREFWFAQLGPPINHLSRQTNPHPRFWHKALTVFVQSVKNFTFSGGFFFSPKTFYGLYIMQYVYCKVS